MVSGWTTHGALGALDGVLQGDQMTAAAHRHDRAHQVAGGVDDALGQERLVEMRVRLRERTRQQVAGELDDLFAGFDVEGRGDRLDQLATNANVGNRAVRQRDRSQQHGDD